jgi:segregation and condensation protein B
MNREINLFETEIKNDTEESGESELLQLSQVKRMIEALLFASSEPLSFMKIKDITDSYYPLKPKTLRQLMEELQQDYLKQNRAFRLDEIAQGFLLQSTEEFQPYIEQLYRNKRTEKLSQASTEVLAIIAYRQPVTKPQIEAIRGVDSTGTLHNLLERGLIEVVGKLEVPGRPILYGITKDFLFHFGLKDLNDLPKF